MPGEPIRPDQYYQPRTKNLVRVDMTYLRQDFSMMLPVENADPWPRMQRYDFLVRTRTVTAQEAEVHREALREAAAFGPPEPYQHIVVGALRQLTERDAGTTSAAWRKMLDLPPREQPASQP
jgi:hypothetical protein